MRIFGYAPSSELFLKNEARDVNEISITDALMRLITEADAVLPILASTHPVLLLVLLFLIYWLETGFAPLSFLPGNSLLFLTGTLSAGSLADFPLLLGFLGLAAFFGNLTSFATGALLREPLSRGKVKWIDQEKLQAAHDFYERHGGKAIIAARFAPIIRAFVPLSAGIARMGTARFTLLSAIAGFLWVGSILTLGRLFGHLPFVRDHLSAITLFALFCAAAGPVVVFLATKLTLKSKTSKTS